MALLKSTTWRWRGGWNCERFDMEALNEEQCLGVFWFVSVRLFGLKILPEQHFIFTGVGCMFWIDIENIC